MYPAGGYLGFYAWPIGVPVEPPPTIPTRCVTSTVAVRALVTSDVTTGVAAMTSTAVVVRMRVTADVSQCCLETT